MPSDAKHNYSYLSDEHLRTQVVAGEAALRYSSVTDLNAHAAPLPRRSGPAPGTREPGFGASLPRRTSGTRRVGRHRSLHRISVSSDAPALVLAIPGDGADSDRELAERIAESAAGSCPGVAIRIGYLSGSTDSLADVLAADPDRDGTGPLAVVVPLLAGPHPVYDPQFAGILSQASAPVMLADRLGPHPLLAGALHDRLSEVGLARASRARGLSITTGGNGVIVVADRGPEAIRAAGVTTVLLAARLAVPAVPASLGDPASIDAALDRLREAGTTHPVIAPCVIGPETRAGEFDTLSATFDAPCAAPLRDHPAVAQLVAVRYGEALAKISVASH